MMSLFKVSCGTKLDLINNYYIRWRQMVIKIKLNDGPKILAKCPKPQILVLLIKNPKTTHLIYQPLFILAFQPHPLLSNHSTYLPSNHTPYFPTTLPTCFPTTPPTCFPTTPLLSNHTPFLLSNH
jgi:hypothetical protein